MPINKSTQKGGKHNSHIKIEDHAYKQLTVVISSKIEQKKKCPDQLCDEYDFSFVKKVKEFITKLSQSIWKTSREHFYIGEVTIIIPSNWHPPTGEEATELNFNGTVSYVNFDEIPIRIYPDKVCQRLDCIILNGIIRT